MNALVGTFNQEKALVGAFSMIVKLSVIFAKVRLKLYYTDGVEYRMEPETSDQCMSMSTRPMY